MVYHNKQKRFNEELASFYNTIPRNIKLLSVHDVKTNICVQSSMFSDVIGLHGLDNSNVKGKYLLFLLKSIKFRVLQTYFKHSNYTTWRSFNCTRSPHMLDTPLSALGHYFVDLKYAK